VLEHRYDLGSRPAPEPFSLPVLGRLGTTPWRANGGSGEFSITDGGRVSALQHRLVHRNETS